MDALQFCYWLQGYFEVRREEVGLNNKQIEVIQDHLQLVFSKVTPNRNFPIYDINNGCTLQTGQLNLSTIPHITKTYWGGGDSYYTLEQVKEDKSLWKFIENIPCPSC